MWGRQNFPRRIKDAWIDRWIKICMDLLSLRQSKTKSHPHPVSCAITFWLALWQMWHFGNQFQSGVPPVYLEALWSPFTVLMVGPERTLISFYDMPVTTAYKSSSVGRLQISQDTLHPHMCSCTQTIHTDGSFFSVLYCTHIWIVPLLPTSFHASNSMPQRIS